MSGNESVRRFYDASSREATKQYTPQVEEYPANQARLALLRRRFRELGVKTLLDAGCGEGSPLAAFSSDGMDAWGFDFSPGMIARAKVNLKPKGLDDHVWHGDIAEAASFRPPSGAAPKSFDACMAMGVIPHLEDEVQALRNMAASVRPGGRVVASFRNELFSLFTLNRYSLQFLRDDLIGLEMLQRAEPDSEVLRDLPKRLERFFRTDLPPGRTGATGNLGYDDILARFHNPLLAWELFGRAGLRVEKLHFYHFHALPPLLEKDDPLLFRKLSLAMEGQPNDWRGHFMASAYIVEATKEC